MSLLFVTPMYGGQCTAEYFTSCLNLQEALLKNGIAHDFLITTNESLITRARNTAVARFLRDEQLKGYDALMFIDADIQFVPEDVAKLWNLLCEGNEVVTAAYPMKREGCDVTAWKDGVLVKLDEFNGPTEIDYAGTGFLMIARSALEKLENLFPALRHKEGHVGEVVALFDTGVSDDREWEDRFYMSEDYAFCERWRKSLGKIILDPSIRLGHVGRRVYR